MYLLDAAMDVTNYTLYQIFNIASIVLMFAAGLIAILVVLFQQSNSDGIQGITGSSETFFGKNKGQSLEYKLKKWTWISLGVLAALSIINFIVQLILA